MRAKKKIERTGRVTLYSAISDDGDIVRFSLHPDLDGEPEGVGPHFAGRVCYSYERFDSLGIMASCRSASCRGSSGPWVEALGLLGRLQRQWRDDDDGWLDWLAEGPAI